MAKISVVVESEEVLDAYRKFFEGVNPFDIDDVSVDYHGDGLMAFIGSRMIHAIIENHVEGGDVEYDISEEVRDYLEEETEKAVAERKKQLRFEQIRQEAMKISKRDGSGQDGFRAAMEMLMDKHKDEI